MKRKLVLTLLCAFALLLLMGAADAPEQAELILAQEESAAAEGSESLETDNTIQFEVNGEDEVDETEDSDEADETEDSDEADETEDSDEADAETETEDAEPAVTTDELVLIDGQPAPIEIGRIQKEHTTYVSLAGMAKALDENVSAVWYGSKNTVEIVTTNLHLSARLGEQYVVANGRYLYLEEPIGQHNGTLMVPLSVVAEAFAAELIWDAAAGKILVNRGSGALVPADSYYDQESLFWLSRVIHAEAGNQPLEGRMAVANVVLNRVSNPIFPNSIQGVLAQKNQFSTYKGGKLANRTPNEGSIIAAKLVLDGGVVEEVESALWFDSKCGKSWAARNKTLMATIGGHKFYG